MYCKKMILLGIIAIFSMMQATGQNLLRNIELKQNLQKPSQIDEWVIKSENPVKRDEIVAFQGLADAMFYFKGEGKAVIRQKNIKVEPNTWYTITAWYKNLSPVNEKIPYGLYLGASDPGQGDWGSFYYKCFGASDKWVKVRAFFNSGKRADMDLIAMLFGKGQWTLGRLVLRKLKDSDFYSQFVVNGDFEKGRVECQPVDFRRTGERALNPSIKSNEGFFRGKNNMLVELSPQHPLALVGPAFITQENDIVKLSLWAKADKPGARLTLSLKGDKFLKESGAKLSTKWRKFELMTKLPSSGPYYIKDTRRLQLYLNADSNEKNIIRFDNVELKTVAHKDAESQNADRKNLLIMNSSFEAGFAGWEWKFFEPVSAHNQGGRVSIDMETAKEGSCSLKINVPAADSKLSAHCFRLRSACFDAAAFDTYRVSFWAKADQENAACRARMFYGNGGNHYLGKEWKQYHAKVVPSKDKQGKNTLMFEFPLNGGTYWIDAIQIEKADEWTAYEPNGKLEVGGVIPSKVYPFFLVGQAVKSNVYFCSRFNKEKTFDFSWEAIDYRGENVASHSSKVTIPANKTIMQTLPLFSLLKGHFIVNFKLKDPDTNTIAESPLVYGIFPEPKLIDPEKSWFGILPGSLNCGRKGNPATFVALKGGNYDLNMKVLKLCGFNWIRTFAAGNWANAEVEKGTFDWKFDKMLQTILDNDLKIYMTMGGYKDFPKWSDSGRAFEHEVKYGRKNYPKIEDWKKYAIKYVEHFKDKVDTITIMSEPQYSADEYMDLVKTLYPAIKKVAPDMKIALPGFPCQALPWDDKDDTWIGKVMKKGLYNYMDIYHGHFYLAGHASTLARVRKEPFESAINGKYGTKVEELNRQVAYFRKTYGDKPIWDTESGTIFSASVPWMEIPPEHLRFDWYTPEVSASRMVRWGIVRMAAGIQRHMYFMFNLPFMHNYHCLDIVNYNMSPRVGLPALSQFAKRLDGAVFKEMVKVGADTWVYIFDDNGKTIAVYWNYSLECKERTQISLPLLASDILAEDMMGNPVKQECKNNSVVLPLGCSPVYVVARTLNVAQMTDAFKKSSVAGGVVCQLRVTPGNDEGKAAVVIGVKNVSSTPLENLNLNLELPMGWHTDSNTVRFDCVEPLKEKTFSIPLKRLCDAPKDTINVDGTIKDKQYSAQSSNLFVATFPKNSQGLKIDGQIKDSEYGGAAAVNLDQPFQIIEKVRSDGTHPIRKKWLEENKPTTAEMWAKWNKDALYVGFKVKDRDVANSAPVGRLFAGDCVEVYLDFNPGKNIFSANYEDHQIKLVFAPANGNYPARFQAEAMGRPINNFKYIPIDKIELKSIKTDTGYNIEAKIPLQNITLNANRLIGFNTQVIGVNRSPKSVYALMWNGKTSWNNPRNFGFALLADK